MSAVETKNSITLRGSTKMVCEYLNYGINSILYQRGVYPPETFKTEDKFGVALLLSQDNQINSFINNVLEQLKEWMDKKSVNMISLVITNVQTKEHLERWDFKLEYESGESNENADPNEASSGKPLKQVQKEIRDVLKQIISTIAILPLLDCLCSFDLLIYTNNDCAIPEKWDQTKPVEIQNAQTVQLRSFSTGFHQMNTYVTYKMDF